MLQTVRTIALKLSDGQFERIDQASKGACLSKNMVIRLLTDLYLDKMLLDLKVKKSC